MPSSGKINKYRSNKSVQISHAIRIELVVQTLDSFNTQLNLKQSSYNLIFKTSNKKNLQKMSISFKDILSSEYAKLSQWTSIYNDCRM